MNARLRKEAAEEAAQAEAAASEMVAGGVRIVQGARRRPNRSPARRG